MFVTLYQCIVMFEDYLGFKHRYNLEVEDNSEGFEWKPMSFCTEPKVLFDKQKVVDYLGMSDIYSKFVFDVTIELSKFFYEERLTKNSYLILSKLFPSYKNRSNIVKYFNSDSGFDRTFENVKTYRFAKSIIQFSYLIFDNTNFVELNSLVVNGNELFECSAKFHLKNRSIDSNAMAIKNCFEYFRIKTTVIANNTFGVCYEFFGNSSSIVMKEEDFVEISIKIKKQRDFILESVYLDIFYYDIMRNILTETELYQYFRWYYFISDVESKDSKSSVITSTRIGLTAELKISKTSIVMLSVPYMTFCEHLGCRHNFYKLTLDNDIIDYNSNTIIKIKNSKKQRLIYHAEPSLEFVDFISNIGGLFALYFGLSFIDISSILKLISRNIKRYLQKMIFYQKIMIIIRHFNLSQAQILQYLKLITKIPWNMILNIFSSPFFVSQMIDLIINYFQYSTQISFEFVEYQQNNQKISINEFPAITVCTEHMFEKAFFNEYYNYFNKEMLYQVHFSKFHKLKRYKPISYENAFCLYDPDVYMEKYKFKTSNIDILNLLIYHCQENSNNIRFLSEYFDINAKEEYHQVIRRIEDKHIYGLNATLDLFDLYVNHHKCSTLYEPNIKCEDIKQTIKMLSPFGKCHTYLMGENNNETYIDKISISTGDNLGELRAYYKRNFILHSSNHLPIWRSNQFRATDIEFGQKHGFIVRIVKKQFIKLPSPYDKKCHDYSERQQFECMNKCIEKFYKDKFECIPNKNNYYTILVDEDISKKNLVFCNESDDFSEENEFFALHCHSFCGYPCSMTYFDEEVIPNSLTSIIQPFIKIRPIEFIIDNVDYLKIIWLPKLTILSLFIKIFNIWSLWHGIHFKLMIDLILKYVYQVKSYLSRKIVININWNNNINYEIIKVRNSLNITDSL